MDDSTRAIEQVRAMERRACDPFKPEPTLKELLRRAQSDQLLPEADASKLSLQELCTHHERRTGQSIVQVISRVERDS